MAMLQAALQANRVTFKDRIEKILGCYKYFYYKYLDCFHTPPVDLNDLIDGVLYDNLIASEMKRNAPKLPSPNNRRGK